MPTTPIDTAATDQRVPVHPARVSRVLAAAGHDRSQRYASGRITGAEEATEGFAVAGNYRIANGHWLDGGTRRARFVCDRILTDTTVRHVSRTLAFRAATPEDVRRRLDAYAAALEAAGYAVEWRTERNDEPVLWVWQSEREGA